MIKRILPLPLLILWMAFPAQAISQQPVPKPLHFEQTRLDLGKLNCQEVSNNRNGLLVKFPYHNQSMDTLWIQSVKGSGGPFVPTNYPKIILPGETGEIEGKFYCLKYYGISEKTLSVRYFQGRKDLQGEPIFELLRVRVEWVLGPYQAHPDSVPLPANR